MTERTENEATHLHLNPVYPEACGSLDMSHTNANDVTCPDCLKNIAASKQQAETSPRLDLGNLKLTRLGDKIWIQDTVNGEGGSFPIEDIQAIIENYFRVCF